MLGTLEQKYTVFKFETHTLLLSDVLDVFSDICEYFHLQINKIEKCLHWCGLDPSNKARAVYIYLSPKINSDANKDWEQFFEI